MALTLGRWLAWMGLGSAGLAVALLPPSPPKDWPPRPVDNQVRTSARLETKLRQAYDELHTAELVLTIDSLARIGLPTEGYPVVLPLGGASSGTRDSLQQQIIRSWATLPGTGHEVVPIYLVLAGSDSDKVWQSRYLLPDSVHRGGCVTLLKSDGWLGRRSDSELLRTLFDETGPCMWYAVHGTPGPTIDRWIRGPGINLMVRYDTAGRSENDAFQLDFGYYVPGMVYQASENLLTCLHGDEVVCVKLVMGEGARQDSSLVRVIEPEWSWRLPMGGESSAWLSDLQREMGVERFSRFWHSELPVAEAFQQAFGMGLGTWNRRWLTRTYSGIHPGPLPRSRSVAYAGGVMLLLFGLAAAVAVRKVG
ncbi:MAG TPA: hypothetical protein VGP80_04710 [Gemmatimonadales bacterium]|nr:hypothetical protein [Gemmatimonadales bacterium]